MATHPLEGQAKRLSAYAGEDEIYEDKPLYQALVEQARIQGCAGATALRGMRASALRAETSPSTRFACRPTARCSCR